ncbi:MAG: proteasome accessory factor PafA2 family protein, partial [Propionicimonas sp.]
RDPLARLELAGGGSLTAVALQREYLEAAAEATEPALAGLWDEVLTALAAQEPERVATEVEWVAKRTLLGRFRRRHGLAADDPRLAQLDLAFHELGGVFTGIEAGGVVRRLTSPEQVRRAIDEPPVDTRAAARGALVDALQGLGRDHSVDWRTCTVHDLPGPDGARRDRTITLDDPLCADSEELTELIAELVGDRSPRATDGSGRSALPG